MATETDVVNDALVSMLGQGPIASLADGTANANRTSVAYAPVRDAVLRSSRWRCAKLFAALVEDTTKIPPIKWQHAFKLPNGDDNGDGYCLRVWDVNNDTHEQWSVGAGRLLYVNDTAAKIEFVGRVTDPTNWDSMLYQAVSTALASKLAVSVLHDLKLSAQLFEMSKQIALDAMSVSGQEGSVEELQTNDLIDVRGDGWIGRWP